MGDCGDNKGFGAFHSVVAALLAVGNGRRIFVVSGGWVLHARSESTEDGTVYPRSCFCAVLLLRSGTGRSRMEYRECDG